MLCMYVCMHVYDRAVYVCMYACMHACMPRSKENTRMISGLTKRSSAMSRRKSGSWEDGWAKRTTRMLIHEKRNLKKSQAF